MTGPSEPEASLGANKAGSGQVNLHSVLGTGQGRATDAPGSTIFREAAYGVLFPGPCGLSVYYLRPPSQSQI